MNPQESFGCQVFSPRVMKEQLPSEVWERLEKATHLGDGWTRTSPRRLRTP